MWGFCTGLRATVVLLFSLLNERIDGVIVRICIENWRWIRFFCTH